MIKRAHGPAAAALRATAAASLLAGAIGCGGGAAPQATAPGPAPVAAKAPAAPAPATAALPAGAVAEATGLFSTRCSPCHGPQGRGDGAASAGLTPRPRDFSEQAWQASVTDAHIEQIIQYGGTAVGKAAMMPPNPDLAAKPDVVKALRAHVRGLGRQES